MGPDPHFCGRYRVWGGAFGLLTGQHLSPFFNYEPGQDFRYVYDQGDYWIHTITLEEIKATEGDNQPAYLDGGGACPPEDCGGPAGYRRLLAALDSPADPYHEEAADWIGADFDPAAAPRPIR